MGTCPKITTDSELQQDRVLHGRLSCEDHQHSAQPNAGDGQAFEGGRIARWGSPRFLSTLELTFLLTWTPDAMPLTPTSIYRRQATAGPTVQRWLALETAKFPASVATLCRLGLCGAPPASLTPGCAGHVWMTLPCGPLWNKTHMLSDPETDHKETVAPSAMISFSYRYSVETTAPQAATSSGYTVASNRASSTFKPWPPCHRHTVCLSAGTPLSLQTVGSRPG